MNKCHGIALFLLTILFSACSDSDDKCGGNGSLRLVYDWSASKSVKPNVNLTVVSENGNVLSLVTDNVGSRLNLPLGVNHFFAYEQTSTVALSGTTFSLAVEPSGNALSPEPFSSGVLVYKIKNGSEEVMKLPMYRQTRELIVRVNFTGLALTELTSVEGFIDKVSAARKVSEGFPPLDGKPHHSAVANAKVNYDFTLSNSGSSLVKQFVGTRRLLGIDGAEIQNLNLILHFLDGQLDKTLNVKEALTLFHIDRVEEAFIIELTIGISEDFTAEIIDWKSGSESTINAN